MAEKRTRRRFTAEFKAQAVKRLLEGGRGLSEVATELGLSPGRVQYAAEPYRRVLERHGLKQSMSRRGDCLDNAPMESFFASLKAEHVHHVRFRTRAEAKAAVFDYVEVFYDRQRLHSALGYRTPAEARASMEGITMLRAA